jgi:hypothetical protein
MVHQHQEETDRLGWGGEQVVGRGKKVGKIKDGCDWSLL